MTEKQELLLKYTFRELLLEFGTGRKMRIITVVDAGTKVMPEKEIVDAVEFKKKLLLQKQCYGFLPFSISEMESLSQKIGYVVESYSLLGKKE